MHMQRHLQSKFLKLGRICKRHDYHNIQSIRGYATKVEMTPKTKQLAESILASSINNHHEEEDEGEDNNNHLLVENERRTTPKRRRALAQAITLIESQSLEHIQQADLLLNYVVSTTNTMDPNTKSSCCYPRHSDRGGRRNSCNDMDFQKTEFRTDKKDSSSDMFRLGFAGAPGAGKSSLIESLGKYILDDDGNDKKHKLAVVCIDPSSSITGGSILGDKTRMMELSRHPRAFVRPSPSKGVLGGLSSYTNDVVTLCGAAGYDLVFVETVGSGQSEIDINQAVDMLVLIVSPGSGDGLQGVKKGILEVADLIVVNKADGSMLPAARTTAADYKGATHFFKSRMEGWETPPVLLASAETGYGLEQLWGDICRYRDVMTNNGYIQKRRAQQARYWMWKHVQELITAKIQSDENIRALAMDLETALDQGFIAPRAAASELLRLSTKPTYPSTSHEK